MTTNYDIHSNNFECNEVAEYVMPSVNQHTSY